MRSDARKKLAGLCKCGHPREMHGGGFCHDCAQLPVREYANRDACDTNQGVCPEPIQLLRSELRMLAHQLLADADTQHPDPFLRGCATGTTDTAQAILNTLGGGQ
jgi:hypothetical protein